MKKGIRNVIAGQLGEYLVSSELNRRGYIAICFKENIPEFDILATDENLNTIPIQVKAIRKGGAFQTKATQWMDIEFKGKVQIIKRKVRLNNPELLFVMVIIGEKYGQDEFYLLKQKDLQNLYYRKYKNWLNKHNGLRPRKPYSLHCAVTEKDLQPHKDNWALLGDKFCG